VPTLLVTSSAKRLLTFGWSHCDGENDEEERFVTVLEIPRIESALPVSIIADSNNVARRKGFQKIKSGHDLQ
jgi:hypothetical protein